MNLNKAKLNSHEQIEGAGLYPYYAGFSKNFVKSILENIDSQNSVVLDPWAGTGITNIIANTLNLQSFGIDINPVMTIISRASLVTYENLTNINDNFLYSIDFDKSIDEEEPLKQWFHEDTCKIFRNLQREITLAYDKFLHPENYYSEETCFYLTVLFLLTKKIVKENFSSSNPTWIKIAKSEEEKINIDKNDILKEYSELLKKYIIKQKVNCNLISNVNTNFYIGSSTSLPLTNQSIDFVLTSPPYCTRIDYAVSMKPELAILNYRLNYEFKDLRRSIIGTTTVDKQITAPNIIWGTSCNNFINLIKNHESRASNTYYYKNHIQYFSNMFNSLEEIYRVLKYNGTFILVVQNSYYKEIFNDIATHLSEMSINIGFDLIKREDFPIQSLSNINKNSSKYVSKKQNFESVIILKK
ncbi:DNA methyltransferase [Acinetobacter sp. ABJ_C5_2]|uniref:DNA methyltransferase n=1 Tax=Acinetobacter sp. ABJ_C5_2 TaxID=3376992 RepID=UPI0037C56B54